MRLTALLGLAVGNGNHGLVLSASTRGRQQDGAFPTSPAQILPIPPSPLGHSLAQPPARAAHIHPVWPKITCLLFHCSNTSHYLDKCNRERGKMNTCTMRLPSQAGQVENLGHHFSPTMASPGVKGLQQHSHGQPSSCLRTKAINGERNLAAMEENSCCSQQDAEELAWKRCVAQLLSMQVLAQHD